MPNNNPKPRNSRSHKDKTKKSYHTIPPPKLKSDHPDKITLINLKPPPFDDLYFESIEDFSTADYIVKQKENLSNLWKTTALYYVKSGYSGVYLAYYLHKRLHYMKSPSEFDNIGKRA